MKRVCFINVDGASRGNPGRAGAGAVIKDLDGNVIRELKEYLGIATNNTAEYKALLLALTAVTEMGIKNVKVFADSELMVKQLNGAYKVKSEDLKPLYMKAIALSKGFDSFEISHVYRENNSLADSLANEAIDSAVK
ncbi:ribonuclease HI family protein [bacterium]|nr:MAG: ribonuclease HI family protein [bacterium]